MQIKPCTGHEDQNGRLLRTMDSTGTPTNCNLDFRSKVGLLNDAANKMAFYSFESFPGCMFHWLC